LPGFLVGAALMLSACAGRPATGSEAAGGTLFHPDDWPGVTAPPRADLFDPVRAGEELPPGFRPVLGRDDILPVYRPNFVGTDEIGWTDAELIIGVDLEGEARAYPVRFLNRREIVVDRHRGIPTFVTW
jgi:hypothetical protein